MWLTQSSVRQTCTHCVVGDYKLGLCAAASPPAPEDSVFYLPTSSPVLQQPQGPLLAWKECSQAVCGPLPALREQPMSQDELQQSIVPGNSLGKALQHVGSISRHWVELCGSHLDMHPVARIRGTSVSLGSCGSESLRALCRLQSGELPVPAVSTQARSYNVDHGNCENSSPAPHQQQGVAAVAAYHVLLARQLLRCLGPVALASSSYCC